MCGAVECDFWETQPAKPVVLTIKPRVGDFSHAWPVCNECDAGLSGLTGIGSRTDQLTMGHIVDKSKGGADEPRNLRAVCTNCNEGLQNAAPQKPDRIHLLAQIRRATGDDQKAVLDWLQKKFGGKA